MKIIIVIFAIYFCCVEGNKKCIPINQCPYLLEIICKDFMTDEETEVLLDSACESAGMVVCPQNNDVDPQCFTLEGNVGTCTSIQQCPHLLNARNSSINQNNRNFLHIHRCEGADDNHVCCGPPVGLTDCGQQVFGANRILGNETAIDQYPWLALIEYRLLKNNSTVLNCGGTLISSKYVLTAGHCVHGYIRNSHEPINVRLSEYDTSSDGPDCSADIPEDCTYGTVVIPIERIIPHRKYSGTSHYYDIALIRLKEEAPYNDFIRPICLPTFDIRQDSGNVKKKVLYVAGWGAVNSTHKFSNTKRHVDVPYVPLEDCRKSYKSFQFSLDKYEICAGGVAGKDSCAGDSGGPLMYNNDGSFSVIGIVSFGPQACGQVDFPAVYTNVYEFLPWIRSHMKP